MKRLTTLILAFLCMLCVVGCKNGATYEGTFVITEATQDSLLVSELGADGKVIEGQQYRVPNWFYSSEHNVKVGDEIKITHNGKIREIYPMEFEKIIQMEYDDRETGLCVTVIAD